MANVSLQKAGSVDVKTLTLVSTNNVSIPLNEFLIEFNLYEDMFSSTLYGTVFLSDSRNLIDKLPIIGEEQLLVDIITPGFEKLRIKKAFRVFKLSDRNIVRDNNTQTYVLHFASNELFKDLITPLFNKFEGSVNELVASIFTNIQSPRYFENFDINNQAGAITSIVGIGLATEKIKFVAPGWTPIKCINWLSSKSLPLDGSSANFLFYETNKSFYFACVNDIFKSFHTRDSLFGRAVNFIGTYSYSPNNLNRKGENIEEQFFKINNIEMVSTTDHVKNSTSGYLSNRTVVLDVFNKSYTNSVFDYTVRYPDFFHTSGKGKNAVPIFTNRATKSVDSAISFYPFNPKLFGNPDGTNVSSSVDPKKLLSRKSLLMDLTNLKLNIVIPGRTDIEVGNLMYINFPALTPVSEQDANASNVDKSYSGYYLITAIHHKVTILEHVMFLEIIKDSLRIEE